MAARGEVDPPAVESAVLEAVPGTTVGPPSRGLIVEVSNRGGGSVHMELATIVSAMLEQGKVGPGTSHGDERHKGNDENLHSVERGKGQDGWGESGEAKGYKIAE